MTRKLFFAVIYSVDADELAVTIAGNLLAEERIMQFDEENNFEASVSEHPRSKKTSGWRIFWSVILVLSIIVNVFLMVVVIGLSAFLISGRQQFFTETIIREGPATSKVVIIDLKGIIDAETSDELGAQIKKAGKDHNVKGLIIRINSPGGTVFASDEIHNRILSFKKQTHKPAVAFMQGVAASGGYYASVACDRLVASPTAITGSIGVIMSHFMLKGLLEDKLGIQPTIIKSGEKKDWPSPFKQMTEQQKQYINEKLIQPAYERFVSVIASGRAELDLAQVKELADGSIFSAEEAVSKKLIDKTGYLQTAIELVKSLAGIKKAQVVEYQRPFSIRNLLRLKTNSLWQLNQSTIYNITTPELMYLWTVP